MELIVVGIIVTIVLISKADLHHKVDNYPINKVSIAKISMDAGKSPEYIQRKWLLVNMIKMMNGKYN